MKVKDKQNLLYGVEVRTVVILDWKRDEGTCWVAINVLSLGVDGYISV